MRTENAGCASSQRFSKQLPWSCLIPLDMNDEWSPAGQVCTVCGKPAFGKAYFARAY